MHHDKMRKQRGMMAVLAISALVLALMVAVSACDDPEEYDDGSPCGTICNRLESCSVEVYDENDMFYDQFDSVDECSHDCQEVEHDATMDCIIDCGDLNDCEKMFDCIDRC